MKATAPRLLPILRSATQGRLLTALVMEPAREHSLTDLAIRAGTSLPTVTREVARAEAAGIVTTRQVGRSRLVKANTDHFVYEPLRELLVRTFGPVAVVTEELTTVTGVDRAFIFGSWAARYHGEPGEAPYDLDVLVVGTPDRDALYDAAERIEARLHLPVQVTVRSQSQWSDGDTDPFLAEVQQRPLVELALRPEEASA